MLIKKSQQVFPIEIDKLILKSYVKGPRVVKMTFVKKNKVERLLPVFKTL